jgi:hypothetical protein
MESTFIIVTIDPSYNSELQTNVIKQTAYVKMYTLKLGLAF